MEWTTLLSANRPGSNQPSVTATRSPFDQDYDRIIFSHPFRRLQDKTQVHPLPEDDFVHTRLTHSLEVSSVGRSLGKSAGTIILQRHPALANQFTFIDFGSIVAAASLAHDLGNPPFGHAGEDAIADFFRLHPAGICFESKVTPAEWADLTRFEGNAQGFRILTQNQYGLKITKATLGAFTKYPCSASASDRDPHRKSQKKFGFFEAEREAFHDLAESLGLIQQTSDLWRRHPLAFLVEAADDICYSIIDLEDGCSLGLVSQSDVEDLLTAVIRNSKSKLGKLQSLTSRTERIGFLRALAIGDLMQECTEIFLDHEAEMLAGTFDLALADTCPSKDARKAIIDVSVLQIYRAKTVVEIEAAGHEILPGLLAAFCQAILATADGRPTRKDKNLLLLLPPEIRQHLTVSSDSLYLTLRRLIDFISGLTDRNAINLFRKIKGMSF